MIQIEAYPTRLAATGQVYEVRLRGSDEVVCQRTKEPFFNAARALIAAGYSPDETLQLFRPGSPSADLEGTLGACAGLRVSEGSYTPPRVVKFTEPHWSSEDGEGEGT